MVDDCRGHLFCNSSIVEIVERGEGGLVGRHTKRTISELAGVRGVRGTTTGLTGRYCNQRHEVSRHALVEEINISSKLMQIEHISKFT